MIQTGHFELADQYAGMERLFSMFSVWYITYGVKVCDGHVIVIGSSRRV